MKGYDILGVGSPILDYILYVDENFLKQFPGKKGGMEPIDYDTLQAILQKTSEDSLIITPGGSGANTIKGLAHLDFFCALLGAIGSDAIAQQYMSFINKSNIIPLFQISPLPTSQVLCLVTPDGERTCRSYLGASQDIQIDQVKPEIFQNVKIVHIEGYSLLQGLFPEKVMELAKEAGAKVSFDLASFELVEKFKDRIMFLLSNFVDTVFANELEILKLTGTSGGNGCKYLKDIAETVVVTQGGKGCWVGQGTALIYQPTQEVKNVDSTGAGDLFASGFLAGYLKGKSLKECAAFAHSIGAAIVQVQGTELPQEKWDEFKKQLEKKSAFS